MKVMLFFLLVMCSVSAGAQSYTTYKDTIRKNYGIPSYMPTSMKLSPGFQWIVLADISKAYADSVVGSITGGGVTLPQLVDTAADIRELIVANKEYSDSTEGALLSIAEFQEEQIDSVLRKGDSTAGYVTPADLNTAIIATASSVETLSNKRFTQRTNSDSASYTTSLTMNSDLYDNYDISAQAGALLFNAPTGTPTRNQTIEVYIKDNGSARVLTYNSVFDWTPPATTTAGKGMRMQFKWNGATNKWNFTGSKVEP